MRTRNATTDRPLRRQLGDVAARGSIGAINAIDAATGDVTLAPELQFVGAGVTGEDGERAVVTITGTGNQVTNASGGPLNYGDVVAQNADGSVTTTTTPQDTRPIGVVQIGGEDGDPVVVVFSGYVAQVNTTASVTSGNYAETSAVAGQATENATPRAGSFGRFLATGANPPARLFGQTYLTGGGSGGGGGGVPSWFNVKDYGATGDGTTDDTSAINDAIAALNAAGTGVLYFPATDDFYAISSALTTITVPAQVMGDGKDRDISRIIQSSTTANIFTTTGPVDFRNIAMSCSGTATAGAAIEASDAALQTFDSVTILSAWIGIDIEDSNGWHATNCYLGGIRKYGMRIRNTASPDSGDWTIDGNCNINGAGVANSAALRIESSGGGKILGSKFTGNPGTGAMFTNGLELSIGNLTTTILLVEGNSFENVLDNLIYMETTHAASRWGEIIITGNEFGQHGGGTGHAIEMTAHTLGGFEHVIIGPNAYDGSITSAAEAVSLTKVDDVRVLPGVIDNNFTSILTSSGCTNLKDFTGGVAAGVAITGTPSAGQVPIASSGAAAAWGTVTGGQHILLADGRATPFTFDDLLQMDDGSDFMWSDPE